MSDDPIQQFRERIGPFMDVFDQLCFGCAAVRIEDKWVSIYTYLTLNNSTDAGTCQPRTIEVGSEFFAFFLSYQPNELDSLMRQFEKGSLSLTLKDQSYQIFLTRLDAGLQSQNSGSLKTRLGSPWRPQRGWHGSPIPYRPSIQLKATGDNFYELIPRDASDRISRQLITHTPPYNGLNGLLEFMGSVNRPNTSGNEALVEIKAILPFDIKVLEDQVIVECPAPLASKLSTLFFFSAHESVTVPYSAEPVSLSSSNRGVVPFPIPWPGAVPQAEAHVRYNEEELERITIRHWTTGANWRVTADSYFDPNSKLLKQALRGEAQNQKEEKRSEAFEQAIVRLLNLGGIAATWHGSLRHSGKPDLAAYCQIPGRRIVLVGECTLEKPNAKLSTLKSRIGKLREKIAQSAEVLAVVFTACDPVQADYTEAAKANIALVGCNEIACIEELVEGNAGPSSIIKQIENTIMVHDFSMVARWAPRYEY
jgi:hypothetical protein